MFAVSFIPIIISGFITVFLGWIWYHPRMFGTAWAQMTGLSPQMVEIGRRRMPLMAFFGLLAAWMVAYVMSYFAIAWEVSGWKGALELAFWIWLGFTAPPMLGTVLWEQKPFRLYFITAAYWYVALSIMALLIIWGMGFSAGVSSTYSYSTDAQTFATQ